MLKYLSPTLLSLVLSTAGVAPAWSATADERDQHAIAVAKLMTSKMRLPADRQLKAYKEAGYPASDPYLDKVLRYTYLDQFLGELPEADKAKNEAELKGLRAELEPALRAGKLVGTTKQIFSGGGGSATRMVNEIAKIMHPEGAPPLVPLANEKVQALTRLLDALGKQAEEDFKTAVDKVKANKAADDKIWDLPEGSKEQMAAINAGVEMRLEALRPFYTAMIALRDAAHRGKDFGIDPAPIQAQIKKMFTSERPELDKKTWADLIAAWDFEWGEFNPFISVNCGTLLGDALVAGAKSVKEEDVEGVLQKVADFSTKEFKDPNVRAEAYRLKFQAWGNLLRYRLMQNNTRSSNRGWAAWQDFLNRAKNDEYMRLGQVPKIASDLGKLYIMAARIAHAKGDSGAASALLAELSSSKPANPYGEYAKKWLAYWGRAGGSSSGSGWSQRPLAMEPEKAIIIAKAFMSEANATADPQVARQNYLSAAVALRNGVLGLASGLAEEKAYIEFGPHVYQLYSYVLYKLDLRHQSVVAAQDGARALAAKIKWYADQKKPNPWKKTAADGKEVWDDSRVSPFKVANDGMIFASQLKTRDPNTQSLYSQSIELLKAIDPEAVGENLRKQQLIALLQENDFEGVMRESEAFLREFPASYLWIFTLKNSAVSQWLDKLARDKDTAKITSLSEQLVKDNTAMGKRIDDELKTNPPDARKRELEKARTTIKVAEVDNLLANKKYEDVIARIDAEAVKNLPSEDTLAARMLRQLSRATLEWHESRKEVLAKDPAALLAAMKTYETVYHNLQRGTGKLRNRGVDSTLDAANQMLAKVFNLSVSMIVKLQQAGNATGDLVAMAEVGNRAFADLFEPTIDDKTSAISILFTARTLWDVDERKRAAKLFARFIALADKDEEVKAFRADPKAVVEKFTPVITARGEFRKAWEEISDLCWDSAEDKQAYETLARDKWPAGRQRVDHGKALKQLAEFRKLMVTNKAVVAPEQYKQIETAVSSFSNTLSSVANQTLAKGKLATYYRESDQFDKALPILMELYEADPLSLDNQMALVLVTYNAALKGNPMPPKEEMQKARGVAAGIRDANAGTTNKVGYWEAYTLVMEFSIMLGEPKSVDDTLSFLRRNRSDISRDLVAPPLWGDDKRARRPMNALSVQLAKRFLSLYDKQGVTEKPAFKIVEVEVGGDKLSVFTQPDAPAFVAKPMTTPDDDEVIAIVAADGSTPPPVKPEPPKPAEPREDPTDTKKPAAGADAKPAEAKPADAKAADAKPADAKPADAKPDAPAAKP